jgi:signal transduction histidine kinase
MPTLRSPAVPLTLRLRAVLAWALIALTLSAGLSVLTYQLTRQHLTAEREDGAVDRAYLNARLLRNALRAPDPDIAAVLSSLEVDADTAVLARVGGEWFSGSVGTGPEELPASLTDAVAEGLAGHQRVSIDDVVHVAIGVPIPAADTRYFEMVAVEDIERTLDGLVDGLVAGAAAAAVVAAAVGFYASGRVLRPLRHFALAAERIADGDLDTRLRTLGDRDLRALERAFNRMADSVQERIDREVRFTSDVSHELRAPVAAMLSTLSIARRAAGDPSAAARALDELDGRVEGLRRTVEDLLELSRVEAGVATLQLEPVEPTRLVAAVLEMMGMDDARVDVTGEIRPIELDKRRVGQMLQNLIENAEHYGGGTSRIEVVATDERIRFAVEDSGPGVPEHERSYIFERFARGEVGASSGTTGSGLGLALVAEHASLHGGTVTLEDGDGGGARFVIDLPARSAP